MENKQKLKAIGIPLTDDCNNCFGVVISEEGQVLGRHVSSNWSWLERDLASKEGLQDYEFIFTKEKPTLIGLFSLMDQVNTVLKEKLEIAESQIEDLKSQIAYWENQ